VSEMERASSEQAQIAGYLGFEQQAYEAVLPQIGASNEIVIQIRNRSNQLLKAVTKQDEKGIGAHMSQRVALFSELRSSGKHSEQLIKTLEAYERCMRRLIVVGLKKPAEFATQFNDNRIPIPQVSTKVQELWVNRDDTSGTDGAEAAMAKVQQNRIDLVAAISEQIKTEFQTPPQT
jgi:exonuclease V gamma subunit